MAFFKTLNSSTKRSFYNWLKRSKFFSAAWYIRHAKILKHAGLGGKSHTMEKGHITWNRKGRW